MVSVGRVPKAVAWASACISYKKVAEAHGGAVSFLVHDDAKVTFELFLPD